MPHIRILPAGDKALLVEFGETIDLALNQYVLSLERRLEEIAVEGLIETVPTFRSLMVCFEPRLLNFEKMAIIIKELMVDLPSAPGTLGRQWHLPVCYDPQFALDIEEICEHGKLTPEAVIQLHTGSTQHVYMLGFLPGQPYLGDLPDELVMPRRMSPRAKIPSGSVGIATKMTCVFPEATPCGLNIIGRTPVPLWNTQHSPQALLGPGDKVIFEPISLSRYHVLADMAANGLLDFKSSAGSAMGPL